MVQLLYVPDPGGPWADPLPDGPVVAPLICSWPAPIFPGLPGGAALLQIQGPNWPPSPGGGWAGWPRRGGRSTSILEHPPPAAKHPSLGPGRPGEPGQTWRMAISSWDPRPTIFTSAYIEKGRWQAGAPCPPLAPQGGHAVPAHSPLAGLSLSILPSPASHRPVLEGERLSRQTLSTQTAPPSRARAGEVERQERGSRSGGQATVLCAH